MFHSLRSLLVLLAVVAGGILLGGCASISTSAQASLENVPYRVVVVVRQPAHTTERAWLTRTAARLMAWTRVSGVEACGEIGVTPTGQHSLIMITNDTQVGCLLRPELRLSGTTDTGWSLHSHPVHDCIHLTRRDHRLLLAEGSADSQARSTCGDVSVFSKSDILTGPGYLASRGRLLSQHGFGTSRILDPSLPVVRDSWPTWRHAPRTLSLALRGLPPVGHGSATP